MKDKSVKSMEALVSSVLQIGVVLSSLIILAGIILFFTGSHTNLGNESYKYLATESYSFPHSASSIIKGLKTMQPTAVIETGVFLLILTPVIRVATSVLIFLRLKDRPMTLVTLFVLAVLIGSFFLGMKVS